jgi:hypothetical protein
MTQLWDCMPGGNLTYMQWKAIATKLNHLLEDLTEILVENECESNRRAGDPEKAADRWVRQYVRSHNLPLPSSEILPVLLARTTYATTFARLSPRQDLEVSTSRAAEIVEILMIDLWHDCFRDKRRENKSKDHVAFAA